MISRSILGLAAALLIASAGVASAQSTLPADKPAAAAKTTKTTKVTKTKVKTASTPAKPRSELSLACSAKATEQGLTGKKRTAFRKKCLKKKAA